MRRRTSLGLIIAGSAVLLSIQDPTIPNRQDSSLVTVVNREYNNLSEEELLAIVHSHNVTLRNEFPVSDLRDIAEVLGLYSEELGDLREYGFSLGTLQRDPVMLMRHSDPNSSEYRENPFSRGYPHAGSFDPVSYDVKIMPKELLDRAYEWDQQNNRTPEGKDRRFDHRWTVAHEIAHALSSKLGFGHALYVGDPERTGNQFAIDWLMLSEQVHENCEPLEYDEEKGYDNRRPEGFPSRHSYSVDLSFGNYYQRLFAPRWQGINDETFADTSSYLILGFDYADNDQWFMRRMGLVKEEMHRIREQK